MALLCIILFTTEGGTIRQWSDPQLWCILAFGLTGIAGFIYEERLAWEPIIPLSLFRDRSFLLCSLIGFIIGMSLFGSVTFLPLYLQVVKDATPTQAGLQLIPLMGGCCSPPSSAGASSAVPGNIVCSRSSARCSAWWGWYY